MPTAEYLDVRGSRYFHAIFDRATGLIKHCDGAIRLYIYEEYQNRLKCHVRNTEARKVGQRIKIFQLDDAIDQNTFALLCVTFFVWNEDVITYFNEANE